MFQRFLVSTDLTDGVYRLATCLSALAEAGVQQAVFLHVVPLGSDDGVPRIEEDKIQQARQQLTASLGQVPATIEVKVDVQTGKALELILKAVQTYGSQVIVLGKPVGSLLNEKLFGSTTTKLAQRSSIPLLVIRPQVISAFTQDELALRCRNLFRTLLIPYDGSAVAQEFLQQVAQHLSQQLGKAPEQIVLCRVIEEGRYQSLSQAECQKQAEQDLAAAKASLTSIAELGIQVKTDVRTGNVVGQLLQAAMELDATAIVVASKTLGKIWELSVPSFAGELLRQSWRPVLFFPPIRS